MSNPRGSSSIERIAAALLAQIDSLADELAARIMDQIGVYGHGRLVDAPELKGSLIDNMNYLLGRLSGEAAADPEAPQRIGRTRAAQDIPLPEILRAYRLGFIFIWERLLNAARENGAAAVDELLQASSMIWGLSDEFSVAMTEAYRAALGERMIEADRRRSGIVSAILDGSSSLSAWEVARLLDLPFEGTFLVVIAETLDQPSAPLPHMDARLRSLGVSAAWRSQPDHEIGVLSLGRRQQDDVLTALKKSAGGRVGVSPTFGRLDGASRAFRLAQVALETLPPRAQALRQLTDDANTDLLVRDRVATRQFVLRVLGKLLALPDDDRSTLLDTAAAWIDARGSAVEAGRVLYCHENTVRHRMHRIEEHIGGSLDDPRLLGDFTTALQAIRLFPELADRLDAQLRNRQHPRSPPS